jgi:hypothetical protein
MEAWNLEGYCSPRLMHVEATSLENSSSILITSSRGDFELAYSGVEGREVISTLKALASPASQVWADLVAGAAQPWQSNLVQQLDALSLVADSEAGFQEINKLDAAVDQQIATAVRTLVAKMAGNAVNGEIIYGRVISILMSAAPSADRFSIDEDLAPETRGNFALQTIQLQHLYVQDNMPVMPGVYLRILSDVGRQMGWSDIVTNQAGAPLGAAVVGLYDPKAVESHIGSFVYLFLLAADEEAARSLSNDVSVTDPARGLNFMRAAEHFAREGLGRLGVSRYISEVFASEAKFGPIVQGLFIEQYHVTTRFVEIIAPLMTKQLTRSMKQRVYQYFREEYGHESFEMATCESLGVDPEQLQKSIPLPLFVAYVDIFTLLGKLDLIGYFASIMVTEGMIGMENPLHERLEKLAGPMPGYTKVARRHDDLNVELNHASLSRLFFQSVEAVSPDAQRRAFSTLAYLLELNYRALNQAADYYCPQKVLQLYRLEYSIN